MVYKVDDGQKKYVRSPLKAQSKAWTQGVPRSWKVME